MICTYAIIKILKIEILRSDFDLSQLIFVYSHLLPPTSTRSATILEPSSSIKLYVEYIASPIILMAQ